MGLLVVFVAGCAGSGAGILGWSDEPSPKPRRIPLRVERPEATADYDVLVAATARAEGDFVEALEALQRAAQKDPDSAVIHEQLARTLWQLDEGGAALAAAERAFELDPQSERIRRFLAQLYRLRRDHVGLDRVLRGPDGRPLDADAAHLLFQVALERDLLDRAEELVEVLAEVDPDPLRSVLAQAQLQERRGDLDAAAATLRAAIESSADSLVFSMRLAQLERDRGNHEGEIAVYREVLDRHPEHYGILQRLGQAQIERDDLEGAIEIFRRIVELYPEDTGSLRRLASLEFTTGRYEEAARRLEEVIVREPDEPELALALGRILRAADQDERAREVFERIAEDDPGYVDARMQIAAIDEEAGRIEQALEAIDRLRGLRPDRALDFQAAALRTRAGDHEGAIALLEGMLDGSENDAEVYYQLGAQLGLQGRVDEALDAMNRVLELAPDNAHALNYIGYTWAERGENLEAAEELIRRALELSPGDGFITDSLGWVYYKMAEASLARSRRDEALRLLDRAQEQLMLAAELTGGDPVVSEHLGDVLLLRGDKAGALEYYEQAVELEIRESEQPDLLEKLDRLRRDLGRPPADGGAR